MNKDRILEVARVIEQAAFKELEEKLDSRVSFDMRWEINEEDSCGTMMCIAGFAAAMYTSKEQLQELCTYAAAVEGPVPIPRHERIWRHAAQLLDLTEDQALELFYPSRVGDYEKITSADAARTLRHLAESEEVYWGVDP